MHTWLTVCSSYLLPGTTLDKYDFWCCKSGSRMMPPVTALMVCQDHAMVCHWRLISHNELCDLTIAAAYHIVWFMMKGWVQTTK